MLKSFPAKVLLLGEYTILNGSRALALPYEDLRGEWSFEEIDDEARENSQKSLKNFLEKTSSSSIDREKLREDLLRGLWFKSSIPQGYGLGSSGAVIAAIFEYYGNPSGQLEDHKRDLAQLEDFFHGASSGLDPLVSHLQRPLLIHHFHNIEVLPKMPDLQHFFLLNTKRPRQTGPLVSIYQEKLKDPQFKQGCVDVLTKEVNFAIEAVIKNDETNLSHHLWHISKLQWDFFPEMIPTKERALWTRGIETGDYILKLCGAGGGGFILGHSQKYNLEEMKTLLGTDDLRGFK
jgi:mevalonate kinase